MKSKDDSEKDPEKSSSKVSKKEQGAHSGVSRKEVLLYCVLAVAVVLAVAFLTSRMFGVTYNVSVALGTNTGVSYPYQVSDFTVNVTNRGSSGISNLEVGFYLNGSAIHYSTVDIPAGASARITENYTYPSSGNYSFMAVADPAHVLNIADRGATASSMAVRIVPAEAPDIYTSIPNSNAVYTQSFTLDSSAIIAAAATAREYNISIFTDMFSPAKNILTSLFENLYALTYYANGAYVRYANGTVAYSAWLQGSAQPSQVHYVLSTFRLKQTNASVNGTAVGYAVVNNQTSICYSYSGGWTKVLSYFNNSEAGSCLGIVSSAYSPQESNVLVDQIEANQAPGANVTKYLRGFVYTNSTAIGSALVYNGTLSMVAFFENAHGFFTSVLQNTTAFVGTAPVCKGLLYASNTASACSMYVTSKSNSSSYDMINTTELTRHYKASLYSLVNQSDIYAAHENGGHLISVLNLSNVIAWKPAFMNGCMFSNASIGCNVTSFDYSSNLVNMSIRNGLPSPLRINTLSCYQSVLRQNETIGVAVASGTSKEFPIPCFGVPSAIASAYEHFIIAMNYTYMNSTQQVAGVLNVTNPGFS